MLMKNNLHNYLLRRKKDLSPRRNLPTLDAMAKQALGRNLGVLLDVGPKGAGDTPTAAPPSAPAGSGVRSLMRGHRASPPTVTRKAAVPRWYLFGGDIVLTILALVTIWRSPHPVSWGRELFCVAAVVLGAGLALGAIWFEDKAAEFVEPP